MKRFKYHIKKLLHFSLLLSALVGISNYGFGQAAGDYRSNATGNWNALATWQTYNGTAWVAAAATPTSANGVITIRSPHTVTVTANVTVDQVIVDASGQITVNGGITLTIANGAGIDMTVSGTLVNSGTITTTGTLSFLSGSIYQHARNGGTIPTATWNAASNCNITGVTNTIPVAAGFNQTFGNFTWNCPGHIGNLYIQSNLTIAGNFTVSGTGTPVDPNNQSLRMSNTGTGYTITVNGNVLIDGSASFKMNNSTGSCTMNVGGNFTLNSGNFTIVTGGASSTLSVAGNVSISGGTIIMNENDATSVGTFNVGGNFTLSGGDINTQNNGWPGLINFNGGTTQIYSKTGGTFTNTINFNVTSGSTLNVGTSLIDGSAGTFTLSSGAGIITAHTQGLSTTAGTGSIRVTGTKTYSTGANYNYNGTSAQVTGNGLTSANNLTINNSAGVTLTGNTTVSGTMTLTSGAFTVGGNILTLNGPTIAGTPSNLTTSSSSSLVFGGTSAGVLIPSSVTTLNGLSITNSNIVTLQNSPTISGTFNPAGAGLSIGANTLTLNGQINCGTLVGGATSNIIIGGAGTADLPAVTLNNLTINRAVSMCGNVTVGGTLTLTSGTFTVGAYTLTLNGPTITGTPSNLTTTASSSLVFGGTSAGVLIPSSVVALNGLSITNSNIVTLQSSPTISGTFNPAGAGLSIGANTLTLNGQINCGTIIGGATSNIIIGGAGSANLSAVTLNNLTINRAVSLCGNVIVGGTLTLTSGTFTVGAYILTLNGPTIAGTPSNLTTSSSSSLVFGGTSAGVLIPSSVVNLNNLTVNNPSGVTLTGSVTVAGTLTMTQGNITTGANTLILSNSTAGSLSYVSGIIIGRLRRAVNTPLSVNYIFPVGTAAFYRPATMNFSSLSAGTDITAEFIATPPAGFTTYTDDIVYLNNTFTEGYWRFFSSGLPSATYSLNLTGNGFTSYTINSVTRITGRDNGNTNWRALGVHGTQSGNDVSRNGVSNLNTTSFDFALATGCITTLIGYRYERNITIDYTKIAGGSDLYSFPVLVNLTGQDFLKTSPAGQVFNVNGFDIIFTDDNYNKLDHQLEYYNATNGDLIAWVRIPTLSSSSNTVIKILYGNPQIAVDPSTTSVWDSHYKGVWHLDDNNLNDFTSFNKAGTPYNTPTYPAGSIYNSLGLDGTNEYVEVINAPNINFAGNITVSAWVYMDVGGRDQKIAGNQNNSSGGYKFGIYTNNKVEFEIRNSANVPSLNRSEPGGTVLSTGQWYYLAGISSDVLDSIKTFVNGNPERPFKKTGILGTASDNLTIGKEPFLSNYYFDGRFDELRISDKVRSNGWMRTEYNNQSSPSTFYTLDAVGVVSNNLPSEGICNVPITLTFGYPSGGTYSGNPYIVGNVFTPPSAGTYSITYTYDGGCGPSSITKDIIIIDIPPAPVASNKEYCTNQIAYLEATSGENIRWYSGGTLVSTANPYSTGQTAAGTYNYTVTQTINGCESAATAVSLIIFNGITINTQPQPATICPDGIANFSVSASGYYLTFQWQEDGVNITDGGIYSGATTPTLTLTSPGITKNGKLYRCAISTSCGASPINSTAALLTIITDYTWTGAVSSDWNTTGNWICGLIPGPTNSVQIPNVSNKPVLNLGAVGTVNNLTIDIGSSLTIDDNTLQIAGNITNNGTFTASVGTIEMNGSAAQTIPANTFAGNAIRNLTINNSSGVTLLGSLDIIEIVSVQSGTLSSGGYLTLVSTAVQTALIDGAGAGTVSGNVTMQRYLPSGFGYKYFSSPFQAATVNEFGDDMNLGASFPAFYRYDESRTAAGWVRYDTATRVLNPMHGYAVNFGSDPAADTVDVTGVVNNGSLSRTIYNNNRTYTKGFNLVGNPYPSPIDWDAVAGWTKTNIDDALYYFKASESDQYGGTYSTYIAGVSSDGLATDTIPSMQGFFVHVSDGTYPVTGTLAMNNSVRVTDLTHSFIKSDGSNTGSLLRLDASFAEDPASKDPVVIYFDEKALNAFDGQLDALKLMNTDLKVPNLYAMSSDGKKLSISALPFSSDTLCEVPLGLKTNKTGSVIFRIRDIEGTFSEMGISFSDKVTGIDQDLLPDNEYSIYLVAGEYQNRFFLNLSNVSTGISGATTDNNLFNIYSSHGILKADIFSLPGGNGILRLFDLTGQLIFIRNIYAPGHYEFNPAINEGIYIASYISGSKRSIKKIFIQNR